MLHHAQILTLAVFLCSYPAYADTYKVITSTAANYKAGQDIKATTIVELKKGESLRLRAQSSLEKCTLTGPFKGKVSCPNLARSLNRLVPKTRNALSQPSNLSVLDVLSSSNFCYDPADALAFWQREASPATHFTLQNQDSDAQVEVPV